MNQDAIRDQLLRILGDIAPDAELGAINPDQNLRAQLDVDSMDLLTFMIRIERELHVAIPETDYRHLTTLNSCAAYIAAHLTTPAD